MTDQTNPIAGTLSFFQKAWPDQVEDYTTQLGCHFEEVAEMVQEITPRTQQMGLLLNRLHLALEDVAKELKRTKQAAEVEPANRVKFLDSLCDQIVTAVGSAYRTGMDIDGAMAEVNRSNMSKFDEDGNPIFDDNGKMTKGPNYSEADLTPYV
jgi:predicted HAD superfamily Cof-like phosphohydrolase